MSLPFTPWPTLQNYSQLNQEAFRYVVRKEMKKIAMDKSSDGESVDALEHFFWAMRGGVVLEMGGLDGNISSQSRVLENVDWKRIIVEGNPQFREGLSKLSTAVTVNAVVCEKTQSGGSRDEVHFVADGRDMFVSGVLEHMTTKFVRRRFPLIYNALAGSPKSLRQSHGESKVFNASAVNWQHPSLQLLLSPHETSRKEGLFSVTPCSFWMWKALRSQFFGPLISRKPPLMSW